MLQPIKKLKPVEIYPSHMVTTDPSTTKLLCYVKTSKPWQEPTYCLPVKSRNFNRDVIYVQ